MPYYVYILASQKNGTLYAGVTNNLGERVFAHKDGRGSAFTSKYGVKRLVYYEPFEDVTYAIAHEKRLKGWRRAWKIKLIETMNPGWDDLYLKLNQ